MECTWGQIEGRLEPDPHISFWGGDPVAWQENTGETSAVPSPNLEWQRLTARKMFASQERGAATKFDAICHWCMNKLHKAPAQKAGGGQNFFGFKPKVMGQGWLKHTWIQTNLIWTSGLAAPSSKHQNVQRYFLPLGVLSGRALLPRLPGCFISEQIIQNYICQTHILHSERKILSTSGGQWDNPKGMSSTTLSFDKHLVLKELSSFKNKNMKNNNNRKTSIQSDLWHQKEKRSSGWVQKQKVNNLLFLLRILINSTWEDPRLRNEWSWQKSKPAKGSWRRQRKKAIIVMAKVKLYEKS